MATNKQVYSVAVIAAIVVNVFSWHLPFFWDTILTSTITQHFYHNGFGNFITPAQFDAGHPPLFYIYVTCFYHVFGKSLFAAHLSLLPFTILGVISFIKIMSYFLFSRKQQFFSVILYFSIPAVVTQNIMVSYDAVLLSLYLAAIATFLKNKKLLFTFILIGIVGISLRGLFCLFSLTVTIYFLEQRNIKNWFKWNLYFIPAILIITCWYGYHYSQTGWLMSTNATGWSNQRGFVNGMGLFKNAASIGRCFFDLGIFILTILSLIYFIRIRKINTFTLLALIPFLMFSISFLPFSNPINHRYYLIVYVLMLPIVIQFLSEKKIMFSILTVLILWLGNLQIYPVPISNGWDCTLAHLSYFKNREKASFILEYHTKFINKSIGTVFPMNASEYQLNMIKDLDNSVKILNVNGKSIDSIDYILFSNIGNDFSDEQIYQLNKWKSIADWKNGQVFIVLYKNPNFH